MLSFRYKVEPPISFYHILQFKQKYHNHYHLSTYPHQQLVLLNSSFNYTPPPPAAGLFVKNLFLKVYFDLGQAIIHPLNWHFGGRGGIKSYCEPPRGGAWGFLLLIEESQADWCLHFDEDSQSVSWSISSSFSSIIPSTVQMKLTIIGSDDMIEVLFIILPFILFSLFCFFLILCWLDHEGQAVWRASGECPSSSSTVTGPCDRPRLVICDGSLICSFM